MRWDVAAFLNRNNIWYKTSGKDVKKGNINIRCPFCIREGRADESGHLGIELRSGKWGCWRNSRHRGASPVRLIIALTNCSSDEARRICGEVSDAKGFTDGLSFDEININDLYAEDVQEVQKPKSCRFQEGIHPLERKYSTARFYNYLQSRGFYEEDLDELVRQYQLHYAVIGDFSNRLILPIYYSGKLQSYTGRSVIRSDLRYKSSKVDESATNIYDCIPGLDRLKTLKNGETLFIVEGPLDYLKVDFYARPFNCAATCLFTKAISDIQINLINLVSKNFKKVIVMLDPDEFRDAYEMSEKLSFMNCEVDFEIIKGAEDPGALSPRQVQKICRNLL